MTRTRTRNKKKIITAGVVAGLLAGAGAGLVLELSGAAGAEQRVTAAAGDDSADDPAGMAEDHAAHLQEILQPLVDDGTLTQAQADAVIAALEAAGPMDGPGGRHGRHGHGPRVEGFGPWAFVLAADTIGVTTEDLRTAIEGGQTIAEVAAANGSSGDAVIAALVAKAQEHIDGHVAEGKYTEDEAADLLAKATAVITSFVNDTPSMPMMDGHRDGDADDDLGGDDA